MAKGQGKEASGGKFAGTTGKRPRTKDDDEAEDDWGLSISLGGFVLCSALCLPNRSRPSSSSSSSAGDRSDREEWPKDKGRNQAAENSLVPPENGRERRTTTRPRTIGDRASRLVALFFVPRCASSIVLVLRRRPRRRLGIGADREDGQRIREGNKRREFRWYRRETAEDEGRRRRRGRLRQGAK
jgi:hypothetical protein